MLLYLKFLPVTDDSAIIWHLKKAGASVQFSLDYFKVYIDYLLCTACLVNVINTLPELKTKCKKTVVRSLLEYLVY
jgi:hypothetical protein